LCFLNVCFVLDSGLITSVNANDSTRPLVNGQPQRAAANRLQPKI
jgi:hypothetical protein